LIWFARKAKATLFLLLLLSKVEIKTSQSIKQHAIN
jgi:hypothetical protein